MEKVYEMVELGAGVGTSSGACLRMWSGPVLLFINTRRLRTHTTVETRHAAWDAQTLPDGAYNLRIVECSSTVGSRFRR